MKKKLRTIIKFMGFIIVIVYALLYADLTLKTKGEIGGLGVEKKELEKYFLKYKEYPDSYNFKIKQGYIYKKKDKSHFEITGKLNGGLFHDRYFKVTEKGLFLWNPYSDKWQLELGPTPTRNLIEQTK